MDKVDFQSALKISKVFRATYEYTHVLRFFNFSATKHYIDETCKKY